MLTWALMWGLNSIISNMAKVGGGNLKANDFGCLLFIAILADAFIFYLLYLVAMAYLKAH